LNKLEKTSCFLKSSIYKATGALSKLVLFSD
jgi:hypothetical protein